jgi:hypothetical protein
MNILTNLPTEIDITSLQNRLRIKPGSRHETELAELAQQAQAIGNPKAVYQEYFIEDRQDDHLAIGGQTFTSRAMALNLAPVEKVYAYVVTAGRELDACDPPSSDMLKKFWWDAVKEEILGAAIHGLDDHLKATFMLNKTATMNPGSGDADVWPIEQQLGLFALLGDGPQQIGVELGKSFLMWPVKTVSGILFATETDFRTCQVCRRENCPNRRAPFEAELWESLHTV